MDFLILHCPFTTTISKPIQSCRQRVSQGNPKNWEKPQKLDDFNPSRSNLTKRTQKRKKKSQQVIRQKYQVLESWDLPEKIETLANLHEAQPD